MLKELNPIIHSQLRLSIMTLLLSVEEADFEFVGRKTRTSCRMTEKGKAAMAEYVEDLKKYLNL